MNQPIIQLTQVSAYYRARRQHVQALKQVDLAVQPGEIFGLLGPNGAGKTTMLSCIEGLHPYEGTITVDGLDVRRHTHQVKRKLQLQRSALISNLTAVRLVCSYATLNELYLFQSIRAGAVGYLLKDMPADALIAVLRQVQRGEPFIQPEVAARALREAIRPSSSAKGAPFALSERERDVLVLLAQGASNREIASRLFITEGTVKNHASNILSKLQAENRTQAADIAKRHGLT